MDNASEIIGRHKQKAILQEFLKRRKSAFVAVIGRRRIGKTFLVDQTCEDYMCLRVTGIQNGDTDTQIMNFANRIAEHSGIPIFSSVNNWQEAFNMLRNYLSTLNKRKKHVIFFDELPWIYTPRSGFMQHLAHFWNDYLSKEKNFVLVVCGSASSWIKKKIIYDRGGLHNRLDATIRLQPFTLSEVKQFLKSRNIKLTNNAIAEIYMTMGGVPYYLENIKRGESHTQIVERMCFSQDGILNYEYENLYKSLFENAKNHEAIVSTLAKARSGLTRSEILEKSGVDSGGPYTRAMEDLIVSGFIQEDRLFGRKKRGSVYRLVDEYTIFYHKFIKNNKSKSVGTWALISNSQKYKIWTGYAFENLCLRHQDEIKRALRIAQVYTEFSQYSSPGNNRNEGFQIDIIIDRNDKIVNLCECKYYNTPFKLTKKSASQLKKRAYLFIEKTGSKKHVFTTLITNHPVIENEYYLDTVDNQINIDHFMN